VILFNDKNIPCSIPITGVFCEKACVCVWGMNMEYFAKWDDKYCIGVDIIDKQHMHLVEIINRLSRACIDDNENTEKEFVEVMKESVEYVLVHFSDEERLMESIQYENFTEHKAQHEQFINTISETMKDFNKHKIDIHKTYAQFLKDWLFIHIATFDQLIGKAYTDQNNEIVEL
jgi:hemerythrin